MVPLEAATGPLFLQVPNGNGAPINSNSVLFTRLPDLRIRAARKDLSAGEQTNLAVTVFAGSSAQTITWAADQGSITGSGIYTAPTAIFSDTFALVTACLQGTQVCDMLTLGLHPFRTDPIAPLIALGGQLSIQAVQGNSFVAPTWTQVTGAGSLLPNGTYTASSSPADGGGTLVSAQYQGVQEQTSIAVTGGFPGLVNRIYDYADLNNPQRATNAMSVAVAGNYLYVLSAQDSGAGTEPALYYIDAYDVTDPANPVWFDTVEAAAAGNLYVLSGILYDVAPFFSGMYPGGAIGAYDISGGNPVLIARQFVPTLYPWSFSQGVLIGFEQSSFAGGLAASADVFFLSGKAFVETHISIPPAVSGQYQLFAIAETSNRAYVTEVASSQPQSGILATYDTSSTPAVLLSTIADFPRATQGFLSWPYLHTDNQIFDVSSDTPSALGSFPEGSPGSGPLLVVDSSGSLVLAGSYENGLRLIDVSDPANPVTTATLFSLNSPPSGVLHGNFVYSAQGLGGLAIYDVSAPGGQTFLSRQSSTLQKDFFALSQASDGNTLYSGGVDIFNGGIRIYDLRQQPPLLVCSISTGPLATNALALSGTTLFAGTDQSLLALDVSNENQPSQISSQNIGIASLAVSGTFLFAGTVDKRLLVFNVANPSSPVMSASINLPDLAFQLTTDGTLLLAADRVGGLLVFNISVPSAPVMLSQLTVPPAALSVQADGNLAILASLETGMVIVDLTNPTSPSVVSTTPLDLNNPFQSFFSSFQNRAAVVALQNKIAFVGVDNFDPSDDPNNGNGAVYGFDYRQPQHPRLVSLSAHAYGTAGQITSLLITGTSMYASGQYVGLIQLNIGQPRNSINQYYPPATLRRPFAPPPPVPAGPGGQ